MLLGLLAFGAGGANYAYGASQSESPVATVPAQADAVIDVPWQLAPEELRTTGGEFRLIFLTDTGFAPDSTDIADYNKFVQEQVRTSDLQALRAYHSGFRVVGSTAAVDARDNTGTTSGSGVPIYWLLGSKVANHYNQFNKGSITGNFWINEGNPRDREGQQVSMPGGALSIFTGSESVSTEAEGNALGADNVAVGRLNAGDGQPQGAPDGFARITEANSVTSLRYYALSPVFRAPARPDPEVSETTEVRTDWTLTPDGPRAGDRFRLLFVTSTVTDASTKGLGPYTEFVQERAAAGHANIRFHAPGFRPVASVRLVDRSDVNARDITGTNFTDADPGLPIYWLNGAKVADHYADFYDGDWDEEAQGRDETGAAVAFSGTDRVWTGSSHDGNVGTFTETDDGDTYTEISALATSNSNFGLPNNTAAGKGPLAAGQAGATNEYPLYAMSGVFEVVPETVLVSPDSPLNSGDLAPGERFRVMFVTHFDQQTPVCAPERGTPLDDRCVMDGRRTIAEYNAFVQKEAREGAWSGNPIGGARRAPYFRALVSTDATDARDNTDTLFKYSDDNDDNNDELGVPIYWLLGDKVANNYRDFYDGTWSNPAAARDRWGDDFDVDRFAVATGSRDDGTVDLTGFLGESGSWDVRAGPSGGGLQGESLLDGDQGLRFYALSPIFEVRKPPPDFTVRVEARAPYTDSDDGIVKGNMTIRAGGTHPAGRIDGAQIDEWEFQGRSLIVKISERELFQYTETAEDNDASTTWGGLKRGHWYALRAIAHWDQGRWTSDWIYARAGYERIFGLDLEPLGVPVGTALARAELPQTKPGGVRGLSASAGETGVALSWREPADNGDGHPVFYRIERALEPGQWAELEPGALETSWTDPSPPESGNVFYRVAAYNAAGAGPWLGAALQLAAADPNTPATGQPTISGTAQVGETLTAYTTGISDDDGLVNVSYGYQWLADDTDIAAATNSTYTLADADEGKAIKVKATFDDDAGNEETLTSAATVAVAAAPSATPLTASHEDAPASHDGQDSFTFKLRFSEEVALSYLTLKDHAFTVTGGTVDKAQRLTQESNTGWTITATPGSDADVILTLPATTDCDASGAVCTDGGKQLSAALTLTVPGPEPPPQQNSPATGAPTIVGTARVDETLTASTSGIADEDGLVNVSYGYQWQADDADVADATGSTYTLAEGDEGKAIKVEVTFEDDAGNEETLTSTATPTVAARPNTPATGAPTIGGTAQVGETLTANPSGIRDDDGLESAAFSYQWLADDTDIADATGSAYVLTEGDEGKAIKVKVTFDDDDGNEETLTSAATTEVVAAPSPLTARFEDQPSSHDGQTAFTFELHFSEEFGVSYATLRDHAFSVTNGTVNKAQRLTQGSNRGWRITVTPTSDADVTVVLPETTDCDDQGAVCTGDGRMLSNRNELIVSGN